MLTPENRTQSRLNRIRVFLILVVNSWVLFFVSVAIDIRGGKWQPKIYVPLGHMEPFNELIGSSETSEAERETKNRVLYN